MSHTKKSSLCKRYKNTFCIITFWFEIGFQLQDMPGPELKAHFTRTQILDDCVRKPQGRRHFACTRLSSKTNQCAHICKTKKHRLKRFVSKKETSMQYISIAWLSNENWLSATPWTGSAQALAKGRRSTCSTRRWSRRRCSCRGSSRHACAQSSWIGDWPWVSS